MEMYSILWLIVCFKKQISKLMFIHDYSPITLEITVLCGRVPK